ncbi:aromatic ring-hydroxylating dioxygenase subunit alpha [Sorangium sp. So ce375]|uniref:aromatic ring-hydroxylating oxygenase subunit alpha n=1 Tax=Sorangium sp. So ce375 TaxID=3133306 RepID=UPI003F5BC468
MNPMRHGLAANYYLDQAIFDLERERIFFDDWLCIGHVAQIPKPGDYITCSVFDEKLFIVRDSDGGVQVHFNVCQHRGSQLLCERSGHLRKHVVCPYHSWAYDLRGRLVVAPHTKSLTGFRTEDYPLRSPRSAVYEGLIFVHFGNPAKPLDEHLGSLNLGLRRYGFTGLKHYRRMESVIEANWKIVVGNYNECAHCPSVHPAFSRVSPPDSKSDVLAADGAYMGSSQALRDGYTSATTSGSSNRRPFPGLTAEEARSMYFYTLFPNLGISLFSDYVSVNYIWPVSVGRTLFVSDIYFDPSHVAQPDFDGNDAVEFWDVAQKEDWAVCELIASGLKSKRGYRPGPYFEDESLLWQFDDYVLDRIGRPHG